MARGIRIGSAVALLLALCAAAPGRPAAADTPCPAVDPVYGLTSSGSVVEQLFCTDGPGRFLPPRVLGAVGDPTGVRVFWGGYRTDGTVVFYAVAADGKLRWFAEDSATGRFGTPVPIGADVANWGAERDLLATGDGEIYGVDSKGAVNRWTHTGWADGSDTWSAEPVGAGAACAGARPVHVGVYAMRAPAETGTAALAAPGPQRGKPLRGGYVAVLATPPSYVYCAPGGTFVTASTLPSTVATASVTGATGPGVAYALTQGDRRLARLVLGAGSTQWGIDATAAESYVSVFVGHNDSTEWPPDPERCPYEWQGSWYEPDPADVHPTE